MKPFTPVKSMQRAASSDTLSTMALGSADGQSCNSDYDAKQQLCHSQSMVLPENGKVHAHVRTGSCACSGETQIEMYVLIKAQRVKSTQ